MPAWASCRPSPSRAVAQTLCLRRLRRPLAQRHPSQSGAKARSNGPHYSAERRRPRGLVSPSRRGYSAPFVPLARPAAPSPGCPRAASAWRAQGRSDDPERECAALRGPRCVGSVATGPSPPRLRGASGEVEAAPVVTAALADHAEAERTSVLVRPPVLDRGVYEPVHADTVRSEQGVRREALWTRGALEVPGHLDRRPRYGHRSSEKRCHLPRPNLLRHGYHLLKQLRTRTGHRPDSRGAVRHVVSGEECEVSIE